MVDAIVWVLVFTNLVLLGGVLYLLRSRLSHPLKDRRSSLEEIKVYVVEELDRGVNANVLRRSLIEKHWPVEVVEQAFRELGY